MVTKHTPKEFRKSTASGKRHWRTNFIKALGTVPNVALACDQAKISRKTAYALRDRSPTFAAAWDAAVQRGIELLEAVAWKRAQIGVVEPIWMKDEEGKPTKVDQVHKPSDTLAIFLLKAHAPHKYREPRGEVSAVITDPDGKSVEWKVAMNGNELP